jgi:hypothetical protein
VAELVLPVRGKARPSQGLERAWLLRMAVLVATGGFLAATLANLVTFLLAVPDWWTVVGHDRAIYLDAAARWFAGGPFYPDRQLAGPFPILGSGEILYPPSSLWLLVPFTFLPAVLWYAVPVAVTAWCVVTLRPARWTWPLIALLVWYPRTLTLVLLGNPTIWVVAALALACRGYSWAGPFVLLKPSLFPFALIGIKSRAWWIGLAVAVVLSVPFWGMWVDWLTVLRNVSNTDWRYSFIDVPVMLIPVLARLSSTSRGPSASTPR